MLAAVSARKARRSSGAGGLPVRSRQTRRRNVSSSARAGGAAPGLARRVKGQLEQLFDDAYGAWVGLLAEMRPAVLAIPDEARRRAVFERLAEEDWLERLRREGVPAVREAMRAVVAVHSDTIVH